MADCPSFYIKMSVLLTGASWRADHVVGTRLVVGRGMKRAFLVFEWVGVGLGWGGDDNLPCTCTHGRCYATSWVGVGWETHQRCHDSRRFHSGFEEVAALTSENKNPLLHPSSCRSFKKGHFSPLKSLLFAPLLGTTKHVMLKICSKPYGHL